MKQVIYGMFFKWDSNLSAPYLLSVRFYLVAIAPISFSCDVGITGLPILDLIYPHVWTRKLFYYMKNYHL